MEGEQSSDVTELFHQNGRSARQMSAERQKRSEESDNGVVVQTSRFMSQEARQKLLNLGKNG